MSTSPGFNYWTNNHQVRHTLATPVSSILVNAQLAFSYAQQEEFSNQSHYLRQVLLSANYLKSLLKMTENNNLNYPFNIRVAIQEVVQIMRSLNTNAEIICYWPTNKSLQITENKLIFQDTITALINNALESYESNKSLKLVSLHVTENEKQIKIAVVDGGRGMEWWKQKLATTKYFTTKKDGTGLGLYQAQKFIKQLGGSLSISSQKSSGTTVKMIIPKKL